MTKKKLKNDFFRNKRAFQTNNIDVNKILVPKKKPYGTKNALKYFIGYNDNDVIYVIMTIIFKASTNDWLCWL